VAASRGLLLALDGNHEQATQQLQALLDRDPEFSLAHYFLGQVYDRQDRFDEAAAALHQALIFDRDSTEVFAMIAYSRARAGERTEAEKDLTGLDALSRDRYVSPALRGLIQLGLGDHEAAVANLEEAAKVRATELAWLNVRWYYDPLRGTSSFDAIVRRVFG
jgi:tetratricopeptide (TPR) repeat protein